MAPALTTAVITAAAVRDVVVVARGDTREEIRTHARLLVVMRFPVPSSLVEPSKRHARGFAGASYAPT